MKFTLQQFKESVNSVWYSCNVGVLLVFAFVVLALLSFQEYGVSFDEPQQRRTGYVNAKYIQGEDDELLVYNDRDYGPIIELPLYMMERLFNLDSEEKVHKYRHLVCHIIFLVGAFYAYLLVVFLYKNKWLGAIAFLLLVMHPRLYGHSFFNSKDIPFLATFIIAFYALVRTFSNPALWRFVLFGIVSGVLINMRIMGVIIPFVAIVVAITEMIKERRVGNMLIGLFLFGCSMLLTLYATWPYLWSNPIGHFIEAFENMSKFRWVGEVLYNGESLMSTELPWYYIPGWFSVTTPIVFLLLGLLGVLALVYNTIKKPSLIFQDKKLFYTLIFFGCFIGPVVVVVLLNSVLYDSWRQLFFIYAGFIFVVIYGVDFIWRRKAIRKITLVSIVGTVILIGIFQIKQFPNQHVYFNAFVYSNQPEEIRKKWEMDYWGVSHKQALEHIAKHDLRDSIRVSVDLLPGEANALVLKPEDKKRLYVKVNLENPDYFITTFRMYPEGYPELDSLKYSAIKFGNSSFSQTYKFLPNED